MKKEAAEICYDRELRLEAYSFRGFARAFPNHFHDHYVIGLVEQGQRRMRCCGREYVIGPGSLILLNPGDNHACEQLDGGVFAYLGLGIEQSVMLELAEEITGRRQLPGFTASVLDDGEAACCLRVLHKLVCGKAPALAREEGLLLLMHRLLPGYSAPCADSLVQERQKENIEAACAFLQAHCGDNIGLDDICRSAGLGRATLIRAFARVKGVTPYRYLQSLRVNAAKSLLEQGEAPVSAALQTGFADQSHFTHTFKLFIGLTPGSYREIFCQKQGGERGGDDE